MRIMMRMALLFLAVRIILNRDLGRSVERNSQKIIARLKREGFEIVSIKGSHHKLRRGNQTIIVPHPKKDLPIGTALAIAKQAGWNASDKS
ncbi:putative RNA binding protein YcfA (HicA-like mRNA interferase family) [Rhizobium leguminosarum]|uniref:Putative RNA binding protein YcfA (HicA-like mRNA interferase family) n=1 Tax=Rhizobium leguminosarum TaxID=384 RepID=A0A7Z0E4N9_RHILE|nr:putative RNA binding protein YcfA (HicA-like mRNA interferase family) [Rhizobium leguminosarum]